MLRAVSTNGKDVFSLEKKVLFFFWIDVLDENLENVLLTGDDCQALNIPKVYRFA
jgi:hypothetical protein